MRVLFLWLLLFAAPALAETLADLPPPTGSYVSDRAGLLAADTRTELDRLAWTLDQSGRGQLGVAVVRTTAGVDQRRFADELLRRWGVGHADRNDGVLLFLALEDRAAEIVLGKGVHEDRNLAHVEAVMQQEMLPRLRVGDTDQALVAGAAAVLQRVYALDLARPAELPPEGPATPFAGLDPGAQAAAPSDEAAVAVAAPVSAPAAPAAPTAAAAPTAPTRLRGTAQSGSDFGADVAIGLAILAALAGGVLWVVWKILRLLWWVTGTAFPRSCSRCSARMQRLDEAADDAHLTPAQRVEEKLGSVDHRVFLCPACGHVEQLARRAWFTRYSDCKACHSRAVSSTSRTISPATRYSTGLTEVTSNCQHCGDTRSVRHVLPVITPASSSSSGSSFGGGSRFGGGSSAGRGASGRW